MSHRTPYRLLIADDDQDIRRLCAAALTQCGYDVSTVADGAAAWQALNAVRFDLLITDNHMPELTGVELLQRLRAARMTVPAILITGTLPNLKYAEYPWRHPAAMLLKPFTPGELLAVVSTVLCSVLALRGGLVSPPAEETQDEVPADNDPDATRYNTHPSTPKTSAPATL